MCREDSSTPMLVDPSQETPPRAWGRQKVALSEASKVRNTPTCVGKTCLLYTSDAADERSSVDLGGRRIIKKTNTPTCVGKTHASTPFGAHLQKHPHVRGEDLRHQPKQIWPGETPPRAWGRRIDFFTSSSPSRNTPTCVGKTITHFPASSLTGKHPHVRGEDRRARRYCHPPAETPPRAWGRPALR